MTAIVTTKRHQTTIEEAKKQLKQLQAFSDTVVRIMTAEQALLAQKVVREAGKKHG